ncbi:MAG: N-acyl homoserine lactonase family protein [Lentisphaeria bacterium]|nr:N-acyl homoserine lactonase family protein [Lentisphaeria bacterium]
MRLHFLQSGYIRTWRHLLVRRAPEGERFTVPIPFYLIEHGKYRILFDTGQRQPEKAQSPDEPFIIEMEESDRAVNQLKKHGIAPQSITHIILSHSHGDHVDGLPDFPELPCFIQKNEADSPGGAALLKKNPSAKWHIVEGDHDLCGDGRIILLATGGHTPGHQSLLLTLDSGEKLLLAADAAYTETALEQYPLDDAEKRDPYWQSIARLQEFRRQGVRVIPGHDPETWEKLQKR